MEIILNKDELQQLNSNGIINNKGVVVRLKDKPPIAIKIGEIMNMSMIDRNITFRHLVGVLVLCSNITEPTQLEIDKLISEEEEVGEFWNNDLNRYLKPEDIVCVCPTIQDKLDVYNARPELIHKSADFNASIYIRLSEDKIINCASNFSNKIEVPKETFIKILKNCK